MKETANKSGTGKKDTATDIETKNSAWEDDDTGLPTIASTRSSIFLA